MLKGRHILVVLGSLPVLGGCFYYIPAQATDRTVGEHLAFQITDVGRAALSERLGQGVIRVEGTLRQAKPEGFEMNVWRVQQIGDINSRWSGEVVTINRDYIGSVEERRLSRPKTIMAVSGATIGLFALAKSLGLGGGALDHNPGIDTIPNTASRGWW